MALTDDAVHGIRQMIITGELAPGDRLPAEKELAARLGLSRNSLREAVRALTLMRVLHTRRGDGTYVTSLDPELLLGTMHIVVDLHHDSTVRHFLEVRRLLEPEATAKAALNLTGDHTAELRTLLDQDELMLAERLPDRQQLAENGQAFHRLIARASGNPVLATIVETVSSKTLRAHAWCGVTEQSDLHLTLSEHRAIYEALAAGDTYRARIRAAAHVAGIEDAVLSAFPARP
ncbi:FadR/GntR family transcriptional regulator [Kitasatospora sp. NPDC057015]|uniref:FadR/GntR family transcriptional regulator n=1 Tax=Kitasatospora sp. NPDC057015 TaxID=3346001 RepID=UPI00363A3B3D